MPDADFFERVGGEPFFIKLVERFYDLVESDLVLRPLYPPNLEPGKVNLAAFLTQYWGGPPHYSLERGHPRLRVVQGVVWEGGDRRMRHHGAVDRFG